MKKISHKRWSRLSYPVSIVRLAYTSTMTSSQHSKTTQKTCLRVLVSGRVQGVGYRYSTREKAIALNIAGWVRNLPDGRVEAMIQGEAHPIDSMMKWFYEGPPAAKVTGIKTEQQSPQAFETFEIRR